MRAGTTHRGEMMQEETGYSIAGGMAMGKQGYSFGGRAAWRRVGLLVAFAMLLLFPSVAGAQTGKEFWFDVPEVNRGHVSGQRDFHVFLHVTALEYAADVTIELPAEIGFTPISFTVPASSTKTIELTDPSSNNSNFTDPDRPMSLFYNASKLEQQWGRTVGRENLGRTNKPEYIENVLGWAESDPNAAKPYLNRTKKGVRMSASATIMAYIEISVGWNMDLIALKGSNALGKKFIVPFQTHLWTDDERYWNMREPPYNSFNIVATQDNTKIKIRVPHEIWLSDGSQSRVPNGRTLPAGEHVLWLNKGESSIIAPYASHTGFNGGDYQDNRGNPAGYQTSRDPDKRLAESVVEVMTDEGSGGDIVVLTRDDITDGPNPDYVADQLVPVSLAGTDFGVVQGVVAKSKNEYLYLMGTQNNTKVSVSGHGTVTLNEGQQVGVQIAERTDEGVAVRATNPILLFHMSGVEAFDYYGSGQKGGAVIPALPPKGKCVGSGEVAFSRAKAGDYVFYLNLLAWDDPDNPANSAIGSFELYKQGPSGFARVTGSEKNLENYLNDRRNWKRFPDVPSPDPADPSKSRTAKWSYMRVNTDAIGAGIAIRTAYQLQNTRNVFHLGVLNGSAGTDAFYGYFSDFKEIEVALSKVQLDGKGEQVVGTEFPDMCFGDTGVLDVPLNKQFTYTWSAPDDPEAMKYLFNSDAFTGQKPFKPRMYVKGLNRAAKYRVTVSGVCDLEMSKEISLGVSVLHDPVFVIDPVVCVNGAGDPPVRVGVKRLDGAQQLKWAIRGPGRTEFDELNIFVDPSSSKPRNTEEVSGLSAVEHMLDIGYDGGVNVGPGGEWLPESTDLQVEVTKGGCMKTFTRSVMVMKQPPVPVIVLDHPAVDCSVPDGAGGYSRGLRITDGNIANALPGTKYLLSYGDGISQRLQLDALKAGVSYTYPASANGYTVRLMAEDASGSCPVQAVDVVVESKPVPKVLVTAAPQLFCSDAMRVVVENGTQDATSYRWYYRTEGPSGAVVTPERPLGTGIRPSWPADLNGGRLRADLEKLDYVFGLEADNNGCKATDEVRVTVLPKSSFSGYAAPRRTTTDACGPYEYEYRAPGAQNVARYEWRWRRKGDAIWHPFATGAAVPVGTDVAVKKVFDNQTGAEQEYEVQLEAWSAEGNCGTVVDFGPVVVPPSFSAKVEGPLVAACPAEDGTKSITLANLTTGGGSLVAYKWYLDGALQTGQPAQAFTYTFKNTDELLSKKFKVELEARVGQCAQRSEATVEIYPRVAPRFTMEALLPERVDYEQIAANQLYCSPLVLRSKARGAERFEWVTMLGNREVSRSASGAYAQSLSNGTSTVLDAKVTLIGTNSFGCQGAYTQAYQLRPALDARVLASLEEACAPEARVRVSALGKSSNPPDALYSLADGDWEAVSGNPQTDPDGALLRYRRAGTHTLRMTVKNADGSCPVTDTSNAFTILSGVQPKLQPLAVASGCAPLSVTLEPQGLQGAQWVRWDFGDGTSGIDKTAVTHTYDGAGLTAPQAYTVRLSAGNNSQCDALSKPVEVTVTVYPSPTGGGNVAPSADPCKPQEWRLANLATLADEVIWNFTPAAAGGAPLEKRGGPADFPADVTLTNTLPNDPLRYSYTQMTYKQWAGGPRCASKPMKGELTVGPTLKQAIALAGAPQGCGNAQVSFTDNSTGGDVRHTWSVITTGDTYVTKRGEPLTIPLRNGKPSEVTYEIQVTTTQAVRGGMVCERKLAQPFSVKVYPAAQATIAWKVVDPCASPLVVQAYAAGAAADAVNTWTTSAPQNLSSTGSAPVSFSFTNSDPEADKTFTINLQTVKTWVGGPSCKASAAPVTVTVPAVPKAVIKVAAKTHAAACGALDVSLDGTGSTGLSKGGTYTWDFGDGQQALGTTATHRYENLGFDAADESYTATLTVRNTAGCESRATLPFVVHPQVLARFALNAPQLCTPFKATVENLSINGVTFSWRLTNPDETLSPANAMLFEHTFDNGNPSATQVRTLQLTATATHADGVTCTSVSQPQSVTVPPRLKPSFDLLAKPGCTPLPVGVKNTTVGVVNGSYTWHWGDYHTATEKDPAPYTLVNADRTASKIVPIRLEVRDEHGCRGELKKEIEVYAAVVADFSTSPQGGCSPLDVEVVNTRPSPAYTYAWSLGSNGTSSQESPGVLRYENPNLSRAESQKETLTLVTRLAAHPECEAKKSTVVEVWPRVIANFTLSKTEGCDPLEVKVEDKTQSAPGARQYVWEATDGQRRLEGAPTFTFRNESRTDVREIDLKVKVLSAQGCGDEWTGKVTVYPTPVSGYEIVGDARGCSPFTLKLNDKAEGQDLAYTYDFGDGTVRKGALAGRSMEHVYSNLGTSPESHILTQRVMTAKGCFAETSQQIHVNPEVTADFAMLPGEQGCSPFEASMSNHSRNANRYDWDFGDGGTSSQETPTHRYVNISPDDVTHTLRFIAFSDYGCADTLSREITVYSAPTARFGATPPAQQFPNTRVTVDNQSQPLVAGWNYVWEWGDGTTSQGAAPDPHVYEVWGDPNNDFIIPIKLTVSNTHCRSVAEKSVIIRAPKPSVEFTANRVSGCPPLEVQMLNSTKYATSWEWRFDDGTPPSTEAEPRHVFQEPGSYHVQLIAEGDGGKQHQYLVFEVFQRPIVEFKVEPGRVFLPNAEVQALNLSVDAHNFRWDFGDGTTSLDESPRHTYMAPGRYDVTLTGLSMQGCEGKKTIEGAVIVDGSGRVRLPTAFHPTGQGGQYGPRDHHNEVFHPYVDGSLQDYKLMVFTRWGEKIFQTTDVNEGWDGTFKGVPCAMGVYAWRVVGSFYDGTVFDMKGSVTLLR